MKINIFGWLVVKEVELGRIGNIFRILVVKGIWGMEWNCAVDGLFILEYIYFLK